MRTTYPFPRSTSTYLERVVNFTKYTITTSQGPSSSSSSIGTTYTSRMESPELSPSLSDSSRPSLGFPLGTALLLLVIFCLSGIFSCCYHWDKVRSLRRSPSSDLEDQSPSKPLPLSPDVKRHEGESLTVLMPGDEIPKFMALPCPRQPARAEILHVKVVKPPKIIPSFPVPLY